MLNRQLCRAALALALSASFGIASSRAQDVAGRDDYLRGANFFAAGNVAEATSAFDRALAANFDDPRVYFLRGLCAVRQNDPATAAALYAEGARLELATEKGRLTNVDETLALVQGSERAPIEEARAAARADWKAREEARQHAIYGESLERQRARLALPSDSASTAAPVVADSQTNADTEVASAPQASQPSESLRGVPSIRPFSRDEVDAAHVPNPYDRQSDEFDYFREDLGKPGVSTKAKALAALRAARNVYEDPMDKPAADGSPFINIYDASEVFVDDAPFVGEDDDDSKYEAAEKNALSKVATTCQTASTFASLMLGGTSQNGQNDPNGYSDYSMQESYYDSDPMGAAPVKKVEPSAADDTKLIFEDAKPAESPFKDAAAFDAAKDFDFFKTDRDFKPTMSSNAAGSGYGSSSGMSMSSSGEMGPDSSGPSAANK